VLSVSLTTSGLGAASSELLRILGTVPESARQYYGAKHVLDLFDVRLSAGGVAQSVRVDDGLEAAHHFRRLHRVRCRTYLEVDVRMRQTQVDEQAIVHVPVVMLAGMNEQRRKRRTVGSEGAQNRRHFHEVRARADDADHRAQLRRPCLISSQ
jgi:hypothetical protein